ncbi:DNA repair protein rad2 [Coemansia aciculifera]|uniref:DNA repair protein rad2 n=1 Tax=Coemansia aciculifera TaxID=417176 RepID=A0A9W8M520_9FUNG|nr:DNA repair protein rad2 [Coemansia aciculifera]
MGVKGLWTLLEPAARPVRLEALTNKRLAIDASIWMYQLLKAMKDDEGNPLEDAHILGFYRRICKLLYYGIRPVFVFDGAAPELKRLTIAERQSMRDTKMRDAKRAAHQLLQTQLKLHILNDAEPGSVPVDEAGPDDNDSSSSPARKRKRDEYELPPLHKSALTTRVENESDLRMAHPDDLQNLIRLAARQSEAIGDDIEVDTESDAFKALSPEDQHDIIVALKVRSRQTSHDRLQHMLQSSETALDFSKQQIDLLVKRNSLTQQWLQVVGHSTPDSTTSPARVSAGRVAAERNREYMLIKSDKASGGWTLRLGGSGDVAVSATTKPELAIVIASSSDADDSDSSEFEDVPPIASESTLPPPQLPLNPPTAVTNDSIRQVNIETESSAFNPNEESLVKVAHAATNGYKTHAAELPDTMSVAATDDEEYAEYVSSSSENGYADSDLDPELLELYDDYDDQERAMAIHEQQQRDMQLQREREEQALLHLPENEFLESWMQLVTKPVLSLDPGIYNSMRQWMLGEPTVVLEQVAWHVNRQLEKQPDISLDEPTDEWLARSPRITADELYFAQARLARLTLVSSYLAYVLRWRQYRRSMPLEWNAQRQQKLQPRQRQEEPVLVSAIEPPSASDTVCTLGSEPVNAIRDLALSSSTVKSDMQSPIEEISNDSEEVRVASETMAPVGEDDVVTPAELELKLAHRDAIFERSRVLAVQGEHRPEPKENGVVQAVKHIDSSGSVDVSDVDIIDVDESWEASVGGKPKEEPASDSDDDDAGADLDTTKRQQSELLRSEQDEYALFVNKLRSSIDTPNGAAPNGPSYAAVRSELESELQVLRSRVRDTRRDASGVDSSMVEDVRMLLTLFGIPYITAPMEAEAQCATLVATQLVDGMVTDDSDAFLFASAGEVTQVYRNFFQKDKFVEMYSSSAIFQDSNLAQRDFVFLAYLLGSDYTVGIKGVGPVLAMEALAEFGPATLESDGTGGNDEAKVIFALASFKDWCDAVAQVLPGIEIPKELVSTSRRRRLAQVVRKTELPASFPDARVARAYFHPHVDESEARFEWGFPNLDLLRQFLGEKLGWSAEKTDETLVPLARKMVDGKQADGANSRPQQLTLDDFAMSRTQTYSAELSGTGLQRSKRVDHAISLHKGQMQAVPASRKNQDKSLQSRRSLI